MNLCFKLFFTVCVLAVSLRQSTADDSSIRLSYTDGSNSVDVHENMDAVYVVATIQQATCHTTYEQTSRAICYYHGNYCCPSCRDCVVRGSECIQTINDYEDCRNTCNVMSDSDLFEIDGTSVQKKQCQVRGCDDCDASLSCVDAGETYSVTVTCSKKNDRDYLQTDDGAVSETFSVIITENAPPTISFSKGTNITINKDSFSVGDTINQIQSTDSDLSIGGDALNYSIHSGPEPSYIHGNILFGITGANVTVKSDLSMEYSNVYEMVLVVSDRRSSVSATLTITLVGCYQTPNCSDHFLPIIDTYGTSHNSQDGLLYTMTSPDPNSHFKRFRSTWEELTWTFSSSNVLDPETTLNQSTGEIHVVQNISIHPAYPSKTFTQVISVENSESCYTASCTLTIIVNYTNWPIDLTPDTFDRNEDNDDEFCRQLTIYDYNYESEDNVTCEIISISPNEMNLFELRNDSNFARTSYSLCKLECQQRGCGYQKENYICPENKGCLTHNCTQKYEVNITCKDAYGSMDSEVFTMNVVKNEAPQYTNLPMVVTFDTDEVAHWDALFKIMYTDNENEALNYSYVFADVDTPYSDPRYFEGSPTGNYTDFGLGRITTTLYFKDIPVNKTYTAVICGHERRNEIVATLTIKLQEYCGTTPNCSHSSTTIDATDTNNDLFEIEQLVSQATNGYAFRNLTYAIAHQYGDMFAVDESTGTVTKNGQLPAVNPYTTYSLSAYVYEIDACGYGHCSLTVQVNFVNEPISITNFPQNVSIHEDDVTTVTIATIETSDNNTDDSVSCEIVNTDSVEPFYITETLAGSEAFVIKKRENSILSSATTTYVISITCSDAYGSNDTGVLTITVELNQGPVLLNLGSVTSINADLITSTEGQIIYIVTAEDIENDELAFNCSVMNNMVPFECRQDGTNAHIDLKRSVRIDYEDGATYSIDVCVGDEKHEASSCGSLSVTFTSNKTAPEISNLPDSVSFSEIEPVGTTLFSLNVSDPDSGEDHTFSMTVTPKTEISVFQLNSEGQLVLVKKLDYERQKTYQFAITVTDKYLGEQASKTLALSVENVNEQNTLSVATQTLTFKEDTVANSVLEDLGITCTDEDEGDTLTYTLEAIYDYFSIDSSTGALTLTKEWDLESGLPTTTTITAICTDSGGLSSSAVINVNIEDVNEYTPVVTILYGDPDQPIQVNSATNPTETFLIVQASDNDHNDDNNFEAKVIGDGQGAQLMRMVPEISKKRSSSITTYALKPRGYFYFENHKVIKFTIRICDGEVVQRCQRIQLCVNYTADAPVAKTKPENKCILCTSNGKAIVGSLVVEAFLVCCFIIHCFCSMVFNGKGRMKEEREVIKRALMAQATRDTVADANAPRNGSRPVSTTSVTLTQAVKTTKIEVKEFETSSSSSGDSDDDDDTKYHQRINRNQRLGHGRLFKSKVRPSNTSYVKSRMSSGKSRVSETNTASSSGSLPQPVYSSRVLQSF